MSVGVMKDYNNEFHRADVASTEVNLRLIILRKREKTKKSTYQ